MASEATIRPLVARPIDRKFERLFFGGMVILLCVIVYVGFARSYYAAGMALPHSSTILRVHAAVFTLWLLVLVLQSALISVQRIAWHRTVGTVAFLLPPLMLLLGVRAALDMFQRGESIPGLDPVASLALPLINISAFSILIIGAWRARRLPADHKRLILFATICLSVAALNRLGRFPWNRNLWNHFGLNVGGGTAVYIGILCFSVAAYDFISMGRIHPSTAWAAPVAVVTTAIQGPIGRSAAWHSLVVLLRQTL
jgi:hypothetical protein